MSDLLSSKGVMLGAPPHDRTDAHMRRIEHAVKDAGFDPEMLNYLPPGYIAAALALGIK